MKTALYPLLFAPVYKDYVWAGSRIRTRYGRHTPHITIAESWEIADRPEGMSHVANGPLKGLSLHQLITQFGRRLLGSAGLSCRRADGTPAFPLLIKIIDAHQRLSLQVHPDERSARLVDGDPKTEMWYVLGSGRGARVYDGFKPGAGRQELLDAMARKTVPELLMSAAAVTGRAFFIPGGRVHAIGEGCLLYEVQQSSHTTYRVYDWDRLDRDGRPRELHVDKALKVINWNSRPATKAAAVQSRTSRAGNRTRRLIDCPFFHVARLDLLAPETLRSSGRSFVAGFVQSGRVRAEGNGVAEDMAAGTSFLLPAALARCTLTPLTRRATIVRTTV